MRYLKGAEGRDEGKRFLRFIINVAVGGVAVAVAALLLTLAIVRGFSQEIQNKIVGFGAHIQVENLEDAPLADADDLKQRLKVIENVSNVSAVVQEYALFRHSQREIEGVALTGVEKLPTFLVDNLKAGSAELGDVPATGGADLEYPGIVIGKGLGEQLAAKLGDRVTLFSVRSRGESLGGFARPRVKQFVVTGIYETSLAHYDDVLVFVGLANARQLLEYQDDEVSRFDLTVLDLDTVEQTATEVEAELGYQIIARSIFSVFRSLFAWINLQQSIIPFVIGVIVVVAAFNIVATLLMIILEKSPEIGVLTSMGASKPTIRRLFVSFGLAIGIAGTAIGSILALVLELVQKRFQVIPLPAESYYLSTAPVDISLIDYVIVACITLILCVLAAYIPARIGSKIDPVKVMRFR